MNIKKPMTLLTASALALAVFAPAVGAKEVKDPEWFDVNQPISVKTMTQEKAMTEHTKEYNTALIKGKAKPFVVLEARTLALIPKGSIQLLDSKGKKVLKTYKVEDITDSHENKIYMDFGKSYVIKYKLPKNSSIDKARVTEYQFLR